MEKYVLSVDIGTSSTRALLYDPSGAVVASSQEFYSVDTPFPGWQEQDPDTIYFKVISAVKGCMEKAGDLSRNLAGVGFSSQMYSIFPIDRTGNPLLKSIIWADSRSNGQAEALKRQYGQSYLYPRTGCPVDSIYPLSKILWIKENLPDIFDSASKFISIKEYVLQKLTGEYLIDYSCASATGMFNISDHHWEPRALEILGISPDRLSTPVSPTTHLVLNNKRAAEETGLPYGCPLIIGAGDGPLANLGSGCMNIGDINIDLGTSGAARTIVPHPVIDKDNRLWCYCLTDDRWAVGGILNNVGNLYKWFLEKIIHEAAGTDINDFSILNRFALKSPPGARGLYFLPFLLQARSPDWDSRLKGTIYGLNMTHNLHDITRAMIEGVAFNLNTIVKTIKENGFNKGRIAFTGGLAKAEAWGQIIADVLGENIILPLSNEGSAGGAAILAMFALGMRNFLDDGNHIAIAHIYECNRDNHAFYEQHYQNYLHISGVIKQLGEKIQTV